MATRKPYPETLILKGYEWTRTVERILSRINSPDGVACCRSDVLGGLADVLAVWHGRRLVGAVVMRIDHTARGQELVIMAAAGELPGVDFTATVLPHIERHAMADNCDLVRFHTARPGLAKRTALVGYEFHEIVMEKRL